ncbi:MAG: type II toxin-antitoxin system RelE/ParE family toxin [Nitrospirae bacterium]|uniref:type II toxin-antitoxin system RelE family toxin n=1 Tax=Candidatus Magnetobacterium casense TaxID=1455061 RepID=UPI0006984975|nr:type II toxin-antitoxin system RelE/ParE family toxin [Candidatus Magnetobacterium casensis]MBF0336595.1 type II toxin-antitoxin system RelE/ParE family toxin [Nitrospirota bacterium]
MKFKLDITKEAKDFLYRLDAKQFKQVLNKILSLTSEPYPVDSEQLHDKKPTDITFRRVDIGEYRIIYFVKGDTINITIIGKRNDNAVYKRYKNKRNSSGIQ